MLLKHNILGVDITERSIRLVQLTDRYAVRAYGSAELPEGVVTDGRISDRERFIESCRTLLESTKPAPVSDPFARPLANVALPESQLWSHTAAVPEEVPHADIPHFIAEEAAKFIPVDVSTLYVDHVVTSAHGRTYATFAGAERALVDAYRAALTDAGIAVERIGSSFNAAARAVLPRDFGDDNYLFIELDETQTNLGVFDENAIAFMAVQSLPVPREQQEQALPTICDDVNRLRAHFKSATAEQITQIVVTGDHPDIQDLTANLADTFDIPVAEGDPFRHIQNPELFEHVSAPASFTNAVGLALSAVDPALPHLDLRPDANAKNSVALPLLIDKLWERSKRMFATERTGSEVAQTFVERYKLILTLLLFSVSLLVLLFIIFSYWT